MFEYQRYRRTTDDGGTGEENGNLHSVGEDITGLNVTDTVFSKNETAEESGNDTDPTNNDDGTAKENGKDVADVKVIGTVSVNGESAEESSDDTYPSSDDNGISTVCRRSEGFRHSI